MCGIVGYTGALEVVPVLLQGLSRLEYRGYDSAGIAVQAEEEIRIVKAGGPLSNLKALLENGGTPRGFCGIGHTRWATHGAPDATNAHPHASPGNRVVMVHNGIIENHGEIEAELVKKGYVFQSQTDTEAAALLLDSIYLSLDMEKNPQERAVRAIMQMMQRLRGSYALGILFGDQPGRLYAVSMNSPLAVGIASGDAKGHIIASDPLAMLRYTRNAIHLCDGEIACMTREAVQILDSVGRQKDKPFERLHMNEAAAEKGGYPHYMLKEMYEQPEAVRRTIAPRIAESNGKRRIDLSEAGLCREALSRVDRLCLIGCGSAYHAACVGKAVIERLARVACEAEIASELRYREPVFSSDTLAVIISQSGETADSLAALRLCRERGVRTLAVVNVPGSAIAREADTVLCTHAGPEISVATTKAYAAQLAALYLLAVGLACARGVISDEREGELADALLALPEQIGRTFSACKDIPALARDVAGSRDVFYIGRGLDYAVCQEGCLKLKEISYIHAEAYAAGELKHGTISLIEAGVPVIAVATQKALLGKTLANVEEARSRGAKILLIAPERWRDAKPDLPIPDAEPLFAASLAVIPLQMLAYKVCCYKGFDVDKPRNLAKAVTVE